MFICVKIYRFSKCTVRLQKGTYIYSKILLHGLWRFFLENLDHFRIGEAAIHQKIFLMILGEKFATSFIDDPLVKGAWTRTVPGVNFARKNLFCEDQS